MRPDSKIFVAGHRGLVGSALCRVLKKRGFTNLITLTRKEVDLTDPIAVRWLFSSYSPEYVFLSAAKVGGIIANSSYPVEFMTENMRIELNVLENANWYRVKKLLFLGTACAYPKFAENPIKETALLTGTLESSNECYALAKIAGIRLCQAYRKEYGVDFISAMPTNLYGVGDHYDPENSHVIPGMIQRIHTAKTRGFESVELWGTGKPTREFLFADDMAEACVLLMEKYGSSETINIGSGSALPLCWVAERIAEVIGYRGAILWDTDRPDGTPERKLDCGKIFSLGWKPATDFIAGLKATYEDFLCRQH